jgi:hypothetical protein
MPKMGNVFKPERLLTKRMPAASKGAFQENPPGDFDGSFSGQGPKPRDAIDFKSNKAQPCPQKLIIYISIEALGS